MTQKSGPPPIVYLLLVLLLGAGGFWYFTQRSSQPEIESEGNPQNPNPNGTAGQDAPAFASPVTLASGTTVRVNGSTSMVGINQSLKQAFENQFPGTKVNTSAQGSNRGIQDLLAGTVDIAASSRALTAAEQRQNLVAVPVSQDEIAIIIGNTNSFRKGLSSSQVLEIFQGKQTDWSQMGGNPRIIRVINRPPVSGTHQTFKELVLQGGNFGITANITTLEKDVTTPLIRALGVDGISYATYAQVANQQTARIVPIDGLTPEADNYPYKRTLYYVYKQPPSPTVEAFLGYVTSPSGQQAIAAP
ncbi:MAG: phosphate ABC transporter substrate-binding protein [Acaryochloridaceae cyanobacterium SU_2_1]|nr:phosphate ABC transporter substrate-binding protein [Acaryochloridaceae cyanobacterium SU_2_1]